MYAQSHDPKQLDQDLIEALAYELDEDPPAITSGLSLYPSGGLFHKRGGLRMNKQKRTMAHKTESAKAQAAKPPSAPAKAKSSKALEEELQLTVKKQKAKSTRSSASSAERQREKAIEEQKKRQIDKFWLTRYGITTSRYTAKALKAIGTPQGSNPWPSAKQYVEIFKRFLTKDGHYDTYTIEGLGRCKLTGTPLQPEWLYKNPKAGIYFLECATLRGRGSFGFPKCENLRKKLFEWKKTSYVNNVPKAKPLISYITANGHGRYENGQDGTFRMRIVKPINIQCANSEDADRWVLVDIHLSDGLARRVGPKIPMRKEQEMEQRSSQAMQQSKEEKPETDEAAKPEDQDVSERRETDPTELCFPLKLDYRDRNSALYKLRFGNKVKKTSPSNNSADELSPRRKSFASQLSVHTGKNESDVQRGLPLSPMKRLSLIGGKASGQSAVNCSPKGTKMQRIAAKEEKIWPHDVRISESIDYSFENLDSHTTLPFYRERHPHMF